MSLMLEMIMTFAEGALLAYLFCFFARKLFLDRHLKDEPTRIAIGYAVGTPLTILLYLISNGLYSHPFSFLACAMGCYVSWDVQEKIAMQKYRNP